MRSMLIPNHSGVWRLHARHKDNFHDDIALMSSMLRYDILFGFPSENIILIY